MKKNYFLILFVAFFVTQSKSQTVLDTLTFEPLLSQVDTFWNGSDLSGGFVESPGQYRLFFENAYDTTYDSWEGFAYSSMRDDSTRGYTNQYSTIAAEGANGSQVYVVGYQGYLGLPTISKNIIVTSRASSVDSLYGVYVNNATYAYYSMLEGDAVSKRFGDSVDANNVVDGTNGEDWFMLTIFDVNNDSVDFYLADFRFADSSLDYIIDEWTWVDLSSLDISTGGLEFKLRSSDNGAWGMNTPAYFCLDNMVAELDMLTSVPELTKLDVNVYPNPTTNFVHINTDVTGSYDATLYNADGVLVSKLTNIQNNQTVFDLQEFPTGQYILTIRTAEGGTASKRIIKQ